MLSALVLASLPMLAVAAGHEPCVTAPQGMVCVPGGPAVVGRSEGGRHERPQRTVEISTFYLDAREVTVSEYGECARSGACEPRVAPEGTRLRRSGDASVAYITWDQATRYCAWAGKRLPTEWEWEKAAGLAEQLKLQAMLGNGLEWSDSWATPVARCGAKCAGRDPRGPCDGAEYCKQAQDKVLRGGAAGNEARRRFAPRESTGAKIHVRCASTEPTLTKFPPALLTESRPAPELLTKPTARELAVFNAVTDDPVEKKKPCAQKGRAFLDCRDPDHYVFSNEPSRHLWGPYIENLGGGYIGVAGAANYSMIARARSRWAWLFDYDVVVVRFHEVLKPFILAAETPEDLLKHFAPGRGAERIALLEKTYAASPEFPAYRELLRALAPQIHSRFRREMARRDGRADFSWLQNQDSYDYIRTMHRHGRIRAVEGDLLRKGAMLEIGKAATKLGIPVRVFYPSNAAEMWPLTEQYRENVRSLPFDARAVVLHTVTGYTVGSDHSGHFLYVVQGGELYQERLGLTGYRLAKQLFEPRVPTDKPQLWIAGLPSGSAEP